MTVHRPYIFAFGLLFFGGCPNDAPVSNSTEPMKSPKFVFPLAIGNRWIYETNINGTVEIETTQVIGSKDSMGLTWWELKNDANATGDLTNQFVMEGDSILTPYPCWGGVWNLELTAGLPRDSTYIIGRAFCDYGMSAQVQRGSGPFVTDIGTILHWGMNAWQMGSPSGDTVFFGSGVGIVERRRSGIMHSPTGGTPYRVVSKLISYEVQHQD